MINKIKQAVIGGIVGTAVMTMIMFIAPMMGMPKMNPAEMLAMMMGFSIAVGWMIHFMIGVIFALSYAFLFIRVVTKINNNIFKGSIFGFSTFIFAQIMMGIMGAIIGGLAAMDGSMILIMIGSIIGHVVFGIVVALFIKE